MLRRRLSSSLLLVGLVASVVGCPAEEEETPAGDDDTADAGPKDNEGGKDPFEIVDAGTDPDGGVEPEPCVDDAAEDNDTTATATALVVGEATSARFCGGDDDWYTFDVGTDCTVSAALNQVAPAEGALDPLTNLNLVLVDATSGVVVGTGAGTGPRDALNTVVPGAGRYALRVDGGDTDDVDYTLLVGVSCAADVVCPVDDDAEDNDTAITASPVVRGVPQTAAACGGDNDFYALPTTPGCMTNAVVDFTNANGDLDFEFTTRADPPVRLSTSNGTVDDERLLRVVDPTTTVARVFLYEGSDVNVGNAYRIELDQVCLTDLACPGDDPFENNDTRQTAAKLEATSEILGAVCGVDEDFFVLRGVGANCTLQLTAAFTHENGDLDLKLLNAAGAEVGSSVGVVDTERITFTPAAAGDFTARIFGVGGAQNTYRLTATTTCP